MIPDSAILDASGAIKLLTVESEDINVLDRFSYVRSPSIYWFEIGNVCWKNLSFGSWSEKFIQLLIGESLEITQIEDFGTHDLILQNALKYEISFYDSSYLSLAIHFNSVLISMDKKLNTAAKKSGLNTFF